MENFSKSPALYLILVSVVFLGSCSFFEEKEHAFSEVRTITMPGTGIGEPFGLAARNGDVFVSDGANGIIWLLNEGKVSKFASGFKTPSHIAFDKKGNLFVADSGDHTVKRVSLEGTVTVVAGVAGKPGLKDGPASQALFRAPIGIAVKNDKIFVADTYNDRIRVIEGSIVNTLAGSERGFSDGPNATSVRFDSPTGLVFWGESLVIADTGNRRLRTIGPAGETRTILGGGGDTDPDGIPGGARLVSPVGLSVDRKGTLYIGDGNSVRAVGRRFVPVLETIAGGDRGFRDGVQRDSRFNRVSGIQALANGDLAIADSENGIVRVLTGSARGNIVAPKTFRESRATAEEFKKRYRGKWPYSPAERAREIAGTLGEIRGEIVDESSVAWFHNGLDIVGGYGEKARTIRPGKILRPHAVSEFGTRRENVRFPDLGYIHIRLGRLEDGTRMKDARFKFETGKDGSIEGLRIPRGSSFDSGEVIGTLNTMNHVHLIAGPSGGEMNALSALSLPGASDSRSPVIEQVELFDESWDSIETNSTNARIKVDGKLRVVATAYDQMDGNAARRRLGLYKLGYRVLKNDGEAVRGFEKTNWSIVFDMTPPNDAVQLVYAPGSRSGATGKTTFRYIVSNNVSGVSRSEGFLDTRELNAGQYLIRVFAADFFGNVASKDIAIKK
ncbi:MAG: hypothetical protein HKN33_09645 [Pyrinomonadaceae bacterium]|nr:hypothetical protein [Pyrinomonadaceae bacterium]